MASVLPLLALGAAGAGFYFMAQKPKKKPASKPVMKHPVEKVKGKSGTTWGVQLVKVIGTERFVDVFLGKARILRYSQKGSDKKSRKYIGSPPEADKSLITRAKNDFGLK